MLGMDCEYMARPASLRNSGCSDEAQTLARHPAEAPLNSPERRRMATLRETEKIVCLIAISVGLQVLVYRVF